MADLDRIMVHWHQHGPPDNVKDCILQVRQAPLAWQSLLRPDELDHDLGPDLTPARTVVTTVPNSQTITTATTRSPSKQPPASGSPRSRIPSCSPGLTGQGNRMLNRAT